MYLQTNWFIASLGISGYHQNSICSSCQKYNSQSLLSCFRGETDGRLILEHSRQRRAPSTRPPSLPAGADFPPCVNGGAYSGASGASGAPAGGRVGQDSSPGGKHALKEVCPATQGIQSVTQEKIWWSSYCDDARLGQKRKWELVEPVV